MSLRLMGIVGVQVQRLCLTEEVAASAYSLKRASRHAVRRVCNGSLSERRGQIVISFCVVSGLWRAKVHTIENLLSLVFSSL